VRAEALARPARPRRGVGVGLGRFFALALALGWVGAAQAQYLYSCTTASGRTLTGDQPPPDCRDRPIRELNRDGSTRRVIEPPLTPEQRRQREAEERRQLEREEQARVQVRRDRALLEAYATEAEIDSARERALANRQALMDRTSKRIAELRMERKRLDDEAEFYSRRELPEKLRRAFATNEQLLKQEEKILADTRGETERITERFDTERRRFRELVDAGATPVQH
jgi:hypothetical protein